MKNFTIVFIILSLCLSAILVAQEKMYIHQKGGDLGEILVSKVDTIGLSSDKTRLNILSNNNSSVYSTLVSEIDSITFGVDVSTSDTAFSEKNVSIENPMFTMGRHYY